MTKQVFVPCRLIPKNSVVPLVIRISLCLHLLYEGLAELNFCSEQTHIPLFPPLAEKDQLCVYYFPDHVSRKFLVMDVYWAQITECIIHYCIVFQEHIALIKEHNAIWNKFPDVRSTVVSHLMYDSTFTKDADCSFYIQRCLWEWVTQCFSSICSLACAHLSFLQYYSFGKTKQWAAVCSNCFPVLMRFLVRTSAIYSYLFSVWIVCSGGATLNLTSSPLRLKWSFYPCLRNLAQEMFKIFLINENLVVLFFPFSQCS